MRLLADVRGARADGRLRLPLLASIVLGGACILVCACSTTSPPVAAGTFEQYYQAALQAQDSGDNERAKMFFELAIRKNPNHPYPHYYLGVLYSQAGELELALVAFERAVKLEPSFFEAYYNMGTIQLKRRELVEAVKLLERALAINPDFVPCYNNLGKAYYLAGIPELAGAAYEEALARDPHNVVALENLILLARAGDNSELAQRYEAQLGATPQTN